MAPCSKQRVFFVHRFIRTFGSSVNCSWCTVLLRRKALYCKVKSLFKKALRLELSSLRTEQPGQDHWKLLQRSLGYPAVGVLRSRQTTRTGGLAPRGSGPQVYRTGGRRPKPRQVPRGYKVGEKETLLRTTIESTMRCPRVARAWRRRAFVYISL
jgi:hypothetical protein